MLLGISRILGKCRDMLDICFFNSEANVVFDVATSLARATCLRPIFPENLSENTRPPPKWFSRNSSGKFSLRAGFRSRKYSLALTPGPAALRGHACVPHAQHVPCTNIPYTLRDCLFTALCVSAYFCGCIYKSTARKLCLDIGPKIRRAISVFAFRGQSSAQLHRA